MEIKNDHENDTVAALNQSLLRESPTGCPCSIPKQSRNVRCDYERRRRRRRIGLVRYKILFIDSYLICFSVHPPLVSAQQKGPKRRGQSSWAQAVNMLIVWIQVVWDDNYMFLRSKRKLFFDDSWSSSIDCIVEFQWLLHSVAPLERIEVIFFLEVVRQYRKNLLMKRAINNSEIWLIFFFSRSAIMFTFSYREVSW